MSTSTPDAAVAKEPATPVASQPIAQTPTAPIPAPTPAIAAPVAPPPAAVVAAPASLPDVAALQSAAAEVQRVREEIAKAHKRDVDERRLRKLREMGLRLEGQTVTEVEVLGFAPPDDPHEPGAEAKFEAFRAARSGWFAPRERTLAERVASVDSLKNPRFKDTKILSYTKVAETILGGNGGRR